MQNFTISFKAMGSRIQVWLNAAELNDAAVLNDVPLWFATWENIFSRFLLESELSKLNRSSDRWTVVSSPMFEVLSRALKAAQDTGGIFNPLVLPALEQAGYDHGFDPDTFVPGQESTGVTVPNWRKLLLNVHESSVWLPEGARIDLGGIVKGWAAQQTAEWLSSFGPCLVDAGGDMVARGTPDDSGGWQIEVGESGRMIALHDSAVATSGTDYRHWERDGKQLHHLIDPRTGQPAKTPVISATVSADDAVEAEVWAKVALIKAQFTLYPTILTFEDGSIRSNDQFEVLCRILDNQRLPERLHR